MNNWEKWMVMLKETILCQSKIQDDWKPYILKSKSISSKENAIESMARILCAPGRTPLFPPGTALELVPYGDSIEM
jgi:hypothetical protein